MKKWAELQSSTQALVIVIFFGALGALLACWWNLSIGEKEFASGVPALDWALRIFLGSFGAVATVFVVAKTDTTKTIHCGVIAALAGMAEPYLVKSPEHSCERQSKSRSNKFGNRHRPIDDNETPKHNSIANRNKSGEPR